MNFFSSRLILSAPLANSRAELIIDSIGFGWQGDNEFQVHLAEVKQSLCCFSAGIVASNLA